MTQCRSRRYDEGKTEAKFIRHSDRKELENLSTEMWNKLTGRDKRKNISENKQMLLEMKVQ